MNNEITMEIAKNFNAKMSIYNSLNEEIRKKGEFINLDELCKLVGLKKDYFLLQAENRKINIWFRVPEDVEVRLFTTTQVIYSDIGSELDYLTVFPPYNKRYIPAVMLEDKYILAAGEPMEMEYLLVSFQDIRWKEKKECCVFTAGARKRRGVCKSDHSNEGGRDDNSEYDQFKFLSVESEFEDPKVFVTCKPATEFTESIGYGFDAAHDYKNMRLDKDRVTYLSIDDMDLYVEQVDFFCNGLFYKIVNELNGIKNLMLEFMRVDESKFLDIPEKLFQIFIVTIRNIRRTLPGDKIERKGVCSDLIAYGFKQRLSDDLATAIVNKFGGDRRVLKFIAAGENEISIFSQLRVSGLFVAYKNKRIDKNEDTNEIINFLVVEYGFNDEAARKISPLIAGTNKPLIQPVST